MTVNQGVKTFLSVAIVAIIAGVVIVAMVKDVPDNTTLSVVLPSLLTCLAMVYQAYFKQETPPPHDSDPQAK